MTSPFDRFPRARAVLEARCHRSLDQCRACPLAMIATCLIAAGPAGATDADNDAHPRSRWRLLVGLADKRAHLRQSALLAARPGQHQDRGRAGAAMDLPDGQAGDLRGDAAGRPRRALPVRAVLQRHRARRDDRQKALALPAHVHLEEALLRAGQSRRRPRRRPHLCRDRRRASRRARPKDRQGRLGHHAGHPRRERRRGHEPARQDGGCGQARRLRPERGRRQFRAALLRRQGVHRHHRRRLRLHLEAERPGVPLGTVVGIAGKYGRSGFLAAFDAASGKRIWQFDSTQKGWEGNFVPTTAYGVDLHRDIAAEKAEDARQKAAGETPWRTGGARCGTRPHSIPSASSCTSASAIPRRRRPAADAPATISTRSPSSRWTSTPASCAGRSSRCPTTCGATTSPARPRCST